MQRLIGNLTILAALVACTPCWGAAPTLVLNIPNTTATRMDPCVVSASIDWTSSDAGESDTANLGGLAWTLTGAGTAEYSLDVSLRSLDVFPGIYHITEGAGLSNAELTQGTAGSLAAGEWDFVNGVLHIRLSDSSNPNSAAGTDITAYSEYTPNQLRILWSYAGTGGSNVSEVPDKYRYCTDPRPGLNSRQIDLTGNDTSNYNRPQGMAWAWPMVEGSWVITASAINPSGYTDSASSSTITIAADSRTEYTVQASGGDYTTLAECLADDPEDASGSAGTAIAARDDVKITIEDGHTENVSPLPPTITGDNLLVVQAGTGTKPLLTFADEAFNDTGRFFVFSGCENAFIENLSFDDSTGDMVDNDESTIACFFVNDATNTGVVGCEVYAEQGVTELAGLGGGEDINGLLVQNCTTEWTRRYSFACGVGVASIETFNGRILLVGNSFGPSSSESCTRFLYKSSDSALAWNRFEEGGSLKKSACRMWAIDHASIYGNYHINGDNTLGDNIGHDTTTASNVRVDACYVSGSSDQALLAGPLETAVYNVTACNNMIVTSDQVGVVKPDATNYQALNNTLWAGDGVTNGLIRSTNAGPTSSVCSNLFVHDDKGDISNFCVYAPTAIGEIRYNTFPDVSSNFAQFDATSDFETSAANMNTNRVFATGNEEKDVTLNSSFEPSSPTTVDTEPGVYADYFGTARGATSWVGAVGSEPASESQNQFQTFIPGLIIQTP